MDGEPFAEGAHVTGTLLKAIDKIYSLYRALVRENSRLERLLKALKASKADYNIMITKTNKGRNPVLSTI